MPLAAGRRLGPYEVVSPVGAGGMGEVYRARDSRLHRDVALKVLPADRSGDPDRLRRFEREAHAVAALNHPNILAVFDVGSEEGTPYVVFELLEGQTLRRRLERGPLPARKSVEYAVQICRGLSAAHGQGILHRDLKPENLFLTSDGQVKILDFGLAKLSEPAGGSGLDEGATPTATDSKIVLGTIGYMSPEQLRSQPVDARSDLFSLGAILYEMLSGRRAFEGESSADRISAILHRDPPEFASAAEHVPSGVERIVRRCLEKDAQERFQTARDLAFALESLSGTAQGVAPRADPASRRPPWPVVVSTLVLLTATTGAFLWGTRQARTSLPTYRQLTFHRGMVQEARFTSDGQTVVYTGLWDGEPAATFSMRLDRPEALALGLPPARLCGVSRRGELAIVLGRPGERRYVWTGNLARVPLLGGTPRDVAESVYAADWSPDGQELAVVRWVAGSYQLELPVGHVVTRPLRGVTDAGFGFRVSPRGDKVAYSTEDGITVIDRGGKVTRLQGVRDETVQGLAWDPSGDAIWAGSGNDPAGRTGFWRIGLDGSAREAARMPGPAMLHDVSADRRLLIHHGFEYDGARARAPGEASEHDVPVLNWTGAIELTNDGRQLLLHDIAEPPLGWSFLRPTSGGPPVRLAEGSPLGISPDARWALVDRGTGGAHQVVLTPTGAGPTRVLSTEGLQYVGRGWFVDATHVLLDGAEPDRFFRTFLLDLEGGRTVPVTPEKTVAVVGTVADGSVIGVARDGSLARYPLRGGEPRPLAVRLPDGTTAIRASGDGGFLYVGELGVPGRIDRLDLATGRRLPWKALQPEDPAGLVSVGTFAVTPDGAAYAYRYLRFLQNLYVVEGIR